MTIYNPLLSSDPVTHSRGFSFLGQSLPAQMQNVGLIYYLLKDEFLTNQSAPLASPRACEPGPGTLHVNDSSNRLSITAGEVVPDGATVGTNNPGFYVNAGYARAAGLALKTRVQRVSAYGADANKTLSPLACAWSTVVNSTNLAQMSGFSFSNVGRFYVFALSTTPVSLLEADADDTYFTFASVLRGTGVLHFINNKLAFVHPFGSTATLYPQIGSLSANRNPPRVDYIRIAQLTGSWQDDFGVATQRLAGSRSASDAFTHAADCILEFTVTTLPSSGTIQIAFRRQDANNYWLLEVTSGGTLNLREVVSGTPTTRANTSVANGDRAQVLADDVNMRLIRLRSDGTHANSSLYTSASNFKTQTAGEILSLGTGGAVSDLIAWPRTSAAYSVLDAM